MSLSTLRADHSDSCTLLSAGVGSHCGKKGEEERGETGGEERERGETGGEEKKRGREEEGRRGRGKGEGIERGGMNDWRERRREERINGETEGKK